MGFNCLKAIELLRGDSFHFRFFPGKTNDKIFQKIKKNTISPLGGLCPHKKKLMILGNESA